ncbi:MAG: hypothetical protein KDI19_03575 [Pseudomonadales bacterium]|nr:hypothetical protein [Pseudomonadales bacterium]
MIRKFVAVIALTLASFGAFAVDMGAVVKAQVLLGQLDKVMDKYQQVQALIDAGTITLDVPEPVQGSGGKYMLPFDADGALTPWAEKALTAQAGAAAGAAVGDKAVGALASKVPFGGLFSSAAKSKTKEAGAVMAIGGWDFIKENSALSFDDLDDYSVYLHAKFNGTAEYEQALAAAMAIYPKLEKTHKRSVDQAYKKAGKQARKLAKN